MQSAINVRQKALWDAEEALLRRAEQSSRREFESIDFLHGLLAAHQVIGEMQWEAFRCSLMDGEKVEEGGSNV